VVCALAGAASVSAGTTLVVSGKGWGHGVGMSQWGAYGYARHGWSWQRILAHYYPGTQVETAALSRVRVLLATGRRRVAVACAGGIRVSDATGRGYALPPGAYAVGRALELPVAAKRVRVTGGGRHNETLAVVPVERALRSPLVFDCPTAPLLLGRRAYHGLLVLRRTGRRLSVVNSLPLDEYVRGVVAGEMPHRWSLAALEAQAVAARSYALATLKPGRHFDLFSDTRSQVYGGIAYETPRSDLAVRRTAGKVLTWNGHVAKTYYFSTSGGRTANVEEVWPRLGRIPYLRSVPDPFDARSPHHLWGPLTFDAQRLARRLGVPPGGFSLVRSPSGRVAAVRIGSRVVDGDEFSSELGLASTWFSVGELSLAGDRRLVEYGRRLTLSARLEGFGRAALQRRIGSGVWTTLKTVRGSERVTVEPRARTLYRLSAGDARGAVVGVAVAPRVDVEPAGSRLLSGSVTPRSRGAVAVWHRTGSRWTLVARPRLDPRGKFRTELRLRPGDYRLTVDGDERYAAATATMDVTPRLLASFAAPGP
jgi:stage II sporulation protein D